MFITDREEDEQIVESFMQRLGNGQWVCRQCPEKISAHKGNLRAHVEASHHSPGYPCPSCRKTFKTRNYFTNHYKICKKKIRF